MGGENMLNKTDESKVKINESTPKKDIKQNQEHNIKKQALGQNIKRK